MPTSYPKRRTGRPPDHELQARRRDEILDVAAKLFGKHGYSGTDTQVLADAIGVGKGTLYRYFPSKEKLFLATVDRMMHRLCQEIDSRIEGLTDFVDRLRIATRTYLRFFDEHPEFVELLIQERAEFKARKKPTYFEYRDANAAHCHAQMNELIAAGRVRKVPAERIMNVINDLLYGTIFTNYFTGRCGCFEGQAEDILDIVFHGIFSERERAQGKK
jgi:AcrR family transcriptional regulator